MKTFSSFGVITVTFPPFSLTTLPRLLRPLPIEQHFNAERQPDGDEALQPVDVTRVGGGLRIGYALLDALGHQAGIRDQLIHSGAYIHLFGFSSLLYQME